MLSSKTDSHEYGTGYIVRSCYYTNNILEKGDIKMTNDMKVLLSLDVSQLKGVEVEALKHSHIEGDFLRGDKLTVYDRWGTMLYAYTEEGFNVLIRVRHARLLSDIELPTYCIFCNTTTENVHSADCPVIDELLKNYFSNNT